MKTDLQIQKYRESLIKYAKRYTVTKAARRYKTNRQYIYRWLNRYDGTLNSLKDKSRRPHSHPNQHTKKELKLIKDMRRRNPDLGLVIFWVKLKQRGYKRHVSSLYRVMKRMNLKFTPKKKTTYKPKPYKQMDYPGQRIQIDTKHVPLDCLPNGQKLYQFTAIDEYTRLRYIEYHDDKSTLSADKFLKGCIHYFPFEIQEVRTDNGREYTNRLAADHPTFTLFEQTLKLYQINHDYIKPYTPRHNGKVERSHRKDNERFYHKRSFINLKDLRGQGKKYLRQYNNFPMSPLDWLSPIQHYTLFRYRIILSRLIFK